MTVFVYSLEVRLRVRFTLHDGDVHSSPAGPGHTGQPGAVSDGGAAPTWHHAGPGQKHTPVCTCHTFN